MNNHNGLIEPIHYYKQNELDDNGLIKPIIYDEQPKGFEEKTYVILYYLLDEEEGRNTGWKVCRGRTETYKYIQEIASEIDIMTSIVLVETKKEDIQTKERGYYLVNIDKSLSVYAFCKSVEQYYSDDSFNIEDYNFTREDVHGVYSTEQMAVLNNSESMKIWNMVLNGEVKDSNYEDESFDPDDERYNI